MFKLFTAPLSTRPPADPSCRLAKFSLAICLMVQAHATFAQGDVSTCGGLKNGVGPFDYRTEKEKLPIVLDAHFPPIVEELIRGNTSRTPGGDIDYTLRAIPNNPRALLSMMRLAEREKTDKPSGSNYTIACWFDRALRFHADDYVVRMLFVTFLTKNNRKPEAMKQLEIVLNTAADNPFTHYNIGLLYFDLDEPGKALIQAHKAMELGLTRTELRDKLKAAGKWEEPSGASSAGNPTEAASAAQKP